MQKRKDAIDASFTYNCMVRTLKHGWKEHISKEGIEIARVRQTKLGKRARTVALRTPQAFRKRVSLVS